MMAFALMLQKDVYPYEYIYNWEMKEEFFSNLNVKVIIGLDCKHSKKT